jgi:DNA-binding beta-propeller fold protein YncE
MLLAVVRALASTLALALSLSLSPLAGARAVASGCGSTPSSSAPSTPDDAAGAAEAAGDAGASDASDPCAPGTVIPTQLGTLDAWPTLDAATAMDRTTAAKVTSTNVSGPPAGVLAAKDGGWVFAALGPAAQGQLGIFKRQGSSLTFDHAIAMPAKALPFGLAQSTDGALVAVNVGPQVVLVDAAKAEANAADVIVASVPNGSTNGATIDVKLSHDDKFAFTALENDGGVAVIDIVGKRYVGVIPIPARGITGIVVSPDGARLYVISEATNDFLKANPTPATDQVIGSVTVIDVAIATTNPGGSVLGRALVGRAPVRGAITDDGNTLWITLRGSNALLALSTDLLLSTTCTPVLAIVPVGAAPVGLALLRGGAGVAVASSNRFAAPSASQTVGLVSTKRALAGAPGALVAQVTVGAFPREIARDRDTLFVSNFNSNSISGIDISGIVIE